MGKSSKWLAGITAVAATVTRVVGRSDKQDEVAHIPVKND
jgi:hypothetical protein